MLLIKVYIFLKICRVYWNIHYIFYCFCNLPRRHRRGVEVWLYTFFNLGTRWVWVVNATPPPLYPLYRRLVRPRSRSGGKKEKLSRYRPGQVLGVPGG
jgi:hypothetical protein